jgi:hypothetical protein
VKRGGSLLATFETGLYDETGKPRPDFALGHLFGISKTGPRERAEYKPNLFNEARGLFLQSKSNNIPYLSTQNIAQSLGIANISTMAGLPDIDISNIQQIGGSASGTYLQDDQRMFAILDSVTFLHGQHSIKVGTEIRFYRMKNFQPSFCNGYFGFRSAETSPPEACRQKLGMP